MKFSALVPVLLFFAASCSFSPGDVPKETAYFPGPMGPYQVGTTTWSFTDSHRKEILTRDTGDYREVFCRIFYPAPWDSLHDSLRCPFSDSLHYHSVIEAPLKKTEHKMPVIILSPGFGATYLSNVTLAEELASRGYIVFNVGHPFFNDIPGKPPVLSNDTFRLRSEKPDSVFTARMNIFVRIMSGDISAVIDRLAEAPFAEKTDTSRIGAIGYSAGGAAAVIAGMHDQRIRCVVNLNGTLFGMTDPDSLRIPCLYMNSDLSYRNPKDVEFEGGPAAFDSVTNYYEEMRGNLRGRAHADYYEVTMKNSTHMDFWDGSFTGSGYEGTIGARRCHSLVRYYSVWFFDNFLLHPGMIRQPDQNFAEAELIKYH